MLIVFLTPKMNCLSDHQQALMLENLQKTSTAHIGLQPNSQVSVRDFCFFEFKFINTCLLIISKRHLYFCAFLVFANCRITGRKDLSPTFYPFFVVCFI